MGFGGGFLTDPEELFGLLPGLNHSAQNCATCKHLGLTSPLAIAYRSKDEPHQKAGHFFNCPLLPTQS